MPASEKFRQHAVAYSEPETGTSRFHIHTISQKTGKHQLGTVADSVDGAVLDDKTLVRSQESLEGRNDPAQVRLVARIVHGPLRIEDIVQGDHLLRLVHGTAANTSQLLHVSSHTKKKTQVHAKSTNIGSSLAADPENTQVAVIVKLNELALVNGSDTQLTLDGRDQGRTLEQSTSKGLECASELRLAARQLVVEADDANVFLSGTLLRFDETGGTVNADNQASSDLGIEGTTVSSLLRTISNKKNGELARAKIGCQSKKGFLILTFDKWPCMHQSIPS